MVAAFLPPGRQTFVDTAGKPLAGGFVYHYIPATSTAKDTWQDYTQTVLNSNPIELDENGQCMIFGNGAYRQRLEDVDHNEIWDRVTTAGNQNAQTLAAGSIFGLTTGNNGAAPNTAIDIAVGQCRDSTNTSDIVLTAGLSKSLAAVWAAGTGQGGRDLPTALATNQVWHVFVIFDEDTGAVDALFSQSVGAPTLPGNFTKFRRIASLCPLGSDNSPAAGTNIKAYKQFGNRFVFPNTNNEYIGQTGSNAALLRSLQLPTGIKVLALLYAQDLTVGGVLSNMRVTDPDLGVPPALGGGTGYSNIRVNSTEIYRTAYFDELTNTSAQVYVQVTNNNDTWSLKSRGYVDFRELG
jgi:hypothetical protein